MKFAAISLVLLSLIAECSDFQYIAPTLGETDIYAMPNNFVTKERERCLTVFGLYYKHIKSFSSGWFGAVFLAERLDGKKFILKAIPMTHNDIVPIIVGSAVGNHPINEVQIGAAIDDVLFLGGRSKAFARTFDWFQCNRHAFLEYYCVGDCPVAARNNGDIDTQFLVMEYVPGATYNQFVAEKQNELDVRRLVPFLRSTVFQALHALHQGATHLEFFHFDLNFNNYYFEELPNSPQQFKFELDGTQYRVPSGDTFGRVLRFIDFGTSKARLPNGKYVGPDTWLRFTYKQGMNFNIRQFILHVIAVIPSKTLGQWQTEDPTSYHEFKDLFNDAVGFERMNSVRGLFAGVKPFGDVFNKQLSDFGKPEPCFSWFGLCPKLTERYLELRGVWQAGAYTMGGHMPDDDYETDVDFKKLLQMDFFRSYILS